MARSENQKLKLFRILEILMRETDESVGISIAELISRLEHEYGISAERKSIYSDFDALGELGFPVENIGGRPPRYTLTERLFELAELKMLVDAVESSRFITAKKSRDIISKLELFAGARHSRELAREVYVEDRVKTVNASSIYSIDTVHTAINDNLQITFRYIEYNAKGEKAYRHGGAYYTVSPIALVWSDDNYYLISYDEAAGVKKHFRVDKMANVGLTDIPRSKEATAVRFNPAEYSKKVFGMYGGTEELVTLECAHKLAGVMLDRFGTDVKLHPAGDGFRFSVRVMISPTFFGWLLGLGKEVRIVSPDSVRKSLVDFLNETLESYGEIK